MNVPSIDGVAFIDPRRSTIDIVQAVGRAIRKSPHKKVGTIVLPVFVSDADDPDRVLDESAFKYVWDVLKALRAHEEVLGEELDALRRRLGAHRAAPRRPGKIKLDIPRRIRAEFATASRARGFEVLQQLRSEQRDPAHGGRPAKIRGAKNVAHQAAVREWTGERPDPDVFTREILPGLRHVPIGELMRETGLGQAYCRRIRLGKVVPHPRTWDDFRRVARSG